MCASISIVFAHSLFHKQKGIHASGHMEMQLSQNIRMRSFKLYSKSLVQARKQASKHTHVRVRDAVWGSLGLAPIIFVLNSYQEKKEFLTCIL